MMRKLLRLLRADLGMQRGGGTQDIGFDLVRTERRGRIIEQ